MLQAKLLRASGHEIEKVGGGKPIPIDVRFISATRQNLRKWLKGRVS
ncbi:MAG: sigma 54-interacting transcriptional regulator [Coprococcus sp.]